MAQAGEYARALLPTWRPARKPIARLPPVELQVMPTTDGDFAGRPVSNPRQLRVLDLRYGIMRAQALTPEESVVFIEQALWARR